MYSVDKSVSDPWRDLKISVYADRNQASFVQTFFFFFLTSIGGKGVCF